MPSSAPRSPDQPEPAPEPSVAGQNELNRLHQVTVLARWALAVVLWIVVGLPCLWGLRHEIGLWLDYFTWAAVRYTIAYNRLLAFGVALCIGMTLSVLIWQSRNIFWGLSLPEQKQLRDQVYRIRRQGASHPLWAWVITGQWRSR